MALLPPLRSLRHPPYALLAVFLAVAIMSAGTSAWLVRQLLAQDAAVERQRFQERLEQVADTTAAKLQRALLDIEALARLPPPPAASVPDDVAVVEVDARTQRVEAPGFLYVPWQDRGRTPDPASGALADAERLEFTDVKLAAALDAYRRLADAAEPVTRAAALLRAARVYRKLGDAPSALAAYERLAAMDAIEVDGLPAALVAFTGRARIFERSGESDALRHQAEALRTHLAAATWPLSRSEYEFSLAEAHRWLRRSITEDAAARARADALEWLWSRRDELEPVSRRLLALSEGPVFAAWTNDRDIFRAVLCGPRCLSRVRDESTPADFTLTIADADGRVLIGSAPPSRQVAVRTAAATGQPWTVHVFASADSAPSTTAPRRRLLLSLLGMVGLVIAAGGYFVIRGIGRELRAARLQADFVAAVSHEFRSPLTSMYQIAQMLEADRFPSRQTRRQSYGVLVRETERLRRLVENLLDFSRFERPDAFVFERIDLVPLVRGVVADFQERVSAAGYVVEPITPSVEVFACADAEALGRALWNLLDNAVKYSGESRRICVSVAAAHDRVSVSVRDWGMGIPTQEQQDIFERFVRGAEASSRRIRGTGLGLALVRQIVGAHRGSVSVESEPGAGSCFTIELAATTAPDVDAARGSEIAKAGVLPAAGGDGWGGSV